MSDAQLEVAVQPEVGSYFVATYPPFSVWTREDVERVAKPALQTVPREDTPLGLYLHIPFCRKRCHFCYFRVYTEKNSQEIEDYLTLLAREMELYARSPAIAARPLNFIYFGGGTPSFLSTRQLENLVERLTAVMPWDKAEEITFECEPGTLTESKLSAIRRMGVTRLSLGVENFDDRILEVNGRAHRSAEIFRAYEFARRLDFPQINIDLIAGMMGETDANWRACIDAVLKLSPDSITIYQMELPFNTAISNDLVKKTGRFSETLATWSTKRRWVGEAFETFEAAGYHIGSAYTAARNPSRTRFVYRDRLWQGADLAAIGVASFGHVNGVHMQNFDTWEAYSAAVRRSELPLNRAYRPTDEERMIRELVLQFKLGYVRAPYFQNKYGVSILDRFRSQLESLKSDGYLAKANHEIAALSREGLLRVDSLLPRFFLPHHAGIRYT
jgi:oxygen-independent coproporphyrinogen-3 oxidase